MSRRTVPPIPEDVPVQTVRHLVRVEKIVWLAVATFVVVMLVAHAVVETLFHDPTAAVMHGLFLTVNAAIATVSILRPTRLRAIETARELDALRRAREEAARLEGALLAARTASHRINNTLSPIAGYAELLTLHRSVAADPTAARYAQQILQASVTVADDIAHLQRIIRIEEDPMGQTLGVPLLDLERSTS
jgi:signal transduction histidine kinase